MMQLSDVYLMHLASCGLGDLAVNLPTPKAKENRCNPSTLWFRFTQANFSGDLHQIDRDVLVSVFAFTLIDQILGPKKAIDRGERRGQTPTHCDALRSGPATAYQAPAVPEVKWPPHVQLPGPQVDA